LLLAFLVQEDRFAAHPLVPLRVFANRSLSAANVVMFFIGCTMFAAFFFVTLYLQEVRDYSPLTARVAALPMSLGIVVGSTAATRLTGWFGPTPPLAAPGIVGRLACTGYTVQNCTSQAVQAAPLKRQRRYRWIPGICGFPRGFRPRNPSRGLFVPPGDRSC
jgi:predicted MFS family arabinose efflux permease